MTEFKLLHAADVHLGRPFSGLERSSPRLADLFRRADVKAWERIVDEAIARDVDALILAGDIFDSSNPSVRARVAFRDKVLQLYEEGIPVFLAAGNHDPLVTFTDSLKNLPGLHLFGPEPEGRGKTAGEITEGVMIYGAGFEKPDVRENLARKFRRDPGIELAIGVLHTNVTGAVGHHNYAPCSLDDLTTAGPDVWCLGHVHSASVLRDYPLVLYSGTSQGAHMEENGPRGCYLVTARSRDELTREFIPVGPVRWESVDLDVSAAAGQEELVSLAESACADLYLGDETVEAAVVGITLTGRPAISLDPGGELIQLLAERLENLPVPIFLSSLNDLTGKKLDLEALESEEGFLGDFLRLCRHTARDADAVRDLTAGIQAELYRKIGRTRCEGAPAAAMVPNELVHSETLLEETASMVAELFFDTDRKSTGVG